MTESRTLVLVVEDDADAAFLIRRLLAKTDPLFEVLHLPDGERALQYFTQMASVSDASARCPALVLLDIKMPKVNGFEVLEWIRASKHAHLPVLVLTTSDDPKDKQRAQSLRADAFLAKFPNLEEFQAVVTRLIGKAARV